MRLYRVEYTLVRNHNRIFSEYYIFAYSASKARVHCIRFIKQQLKKEPYELKILSSLPYCSIEYGLPRYSN